MKKMLLMAMAAAGVLTACTSNDGFDNEVAKGDLQQIKLGVSAAVSTSRGTGTVGSADSESNAWAGQYLWVSMLDKGTLNATKYEAVGGVVSDGPIFEDKLFVAPADGDEGLTTADDGTIAYYPTQGASDFWGYRVDDAANLNDEPGFSPKTKPAVLLCNSQNEEVEAAQATRRVVELKINGSQDIMAGKAEIGADADLLGTQPENFFSAFSARKGVQPNINFNHLLTRFTFQVKAGNKAATGDAGAGTQPVQVTKVTVSSKNCAKLVVAYTEAQQPQLLTFNDEEPVELALMQRTGSANDALTALQTVPLTWNAEENEGETLPVGESLMVAPGETEYTMHLTLAQTVQVKADGTTASKTLEIIKPIKLPSADAFQAGHSYNVVITVYGLEKVDVNATLVPWRDGGSIDIDFDQN